MDKQTVLDETEKVLDAIEDKIDSVEEIEEVVARNKTVSTVLLVGGVALIAASSAFAGYKYAQRKLKVKYEEMASLEIQQAKEYYGRFHKTDPKFATPEAALETLVPEDEREDDDAPTQAEMLQDAVKAVSSEYQTETPHHDYTQYTKVEVKQDEDKVVVEEERVEVTKNVFTDADLSKWDYDTEVEKRSPEVPYIITEEEYLQNDPEHDQSSLTYYEKDDILADAADKVIDDTDTYVGDDNLVRFGHGSGNKDIVFVRNEKIECDFEIERSTGSYAEEVAGFRHSDDDRRIRRFRHGDDG